jgi:single-stranded-DNA-specific exonuclease
LADPELFARQTFTDGSLDGDCLSLEFATLLREGGPWGQQFPEPVFHGDFRVLGSRVLAEKHRKLTLQVPGSQRVVDAIAFNLEPRLLQQQGERVRLLYKLDINEFRGQTTTQLLVEKLEFL